MKILFFLLGLFPAFPLSAQSPEQDCEVVTDPQGNKFLRWFGHAGRSYGIQISDPAEHESGGNSGHLKRWVFADLIEVGHDEIISYEVDGTAPAGFFRLKYVNAIPLPGQPPEEADLDGDGIPTWWELAHGLDPFDPYDASLDNDGDEESNLSEYLQGSNPNSTDSFPARLVWCERRSYLNWNSYQESGLLRHVALWDGNPTVEELLTTLPTPSHAMAPQLASAQPFPNGPPPQSYRTSFLTGGLPSMEGSYKYFTGSPAQGGISNAFSSLSHARVWLRIAEDHESEKTRNFPFALLKEKLKWVVNEGGYAVGAPVQTSVSYEPLNLILPANSTISNAIDVEPDFWVIPSGYFTETRFHLLNLAIRVTIDPFPELPRDGVCVPQGTGLSFAIPSLVSIPDAPVPIWETRQLQRNGSFESWQVVGYGNPFVFNAQEGGIYQLRAKLTLGEQPIEVIWARHRDDNGGADSNGTYNDHYRFGEPDFFGVASRAIQLEVRRHARLNLGSTYYSVSNSTPISHGGPVFGGGSNKCNLFVYHKANDAGAFVPLVNGIPKKYPPTAFQWWSSFYEIGDWLRLAKQPGWGEHLPPEPGFVVAGPDGEAHPYWNPYGHVGILDYDGAWIQAGSAHVNKNPHLSTHLSHPYQPAGFRQYRNP